MEPPRISIVMLTFNRPQFISRAIESIVAQGYPGWELIVVQDGNNQEIASIMREWERRDRRVRYFHRTVPGNIAEATNFGLRQARGEYIAILDDDDYWPDADKLGKQMCFLDEHPDYAACGGGVIVIDQDGRETLRYFKPCEDGEIKRRALLANPIAHGTSMYRRSAVERCGLYDETLAGFQDWDVWLKLGQIGKLYNFREYLLCYQIWHGGGSFHQQKGNTRSALRIVKRHRKTYSGFPAAYTMALLYHAYAHLPVAVKKTTFAFLSRLKKTVFAERRASSREIGA